MNTRCRLIAWGALFVGLGLAYLFQARPAGAAEPLADPGPILIPAEGVESLGPSISAVSASRWNVCYKRHILGPKCKCCLPPVNVVLQVKEPCGCCLIDVPVCIPACCTGAPEVHCRRGVFGRHVVTYDWCCGYHLKIVMTKHGDLIVHYFGQ